MEILKEMLLVYLKALDLVLNQFLIIKESLCLKIQVKPLSFLKNIRYYIGEKDRVEPD